MSTSATSILGDAVAEASPSAFQPRLCSSCDEPIPVKRLVAVPHASKCVQCLTAAGDVSLTRRFEQIVGSLEEHDVVPIHYRQPNQYLQKAMSEAAAKVGLSTARANDAGKPTKLFKRAGFVIPRLNPVSDN